MQITFSTPLDHETRSKYLHCLLVVLTSVGNAHGTVSLSKTPDFMAELTLLG